MDSLDFELEYLDDKLFNELLDSGWDVIYLRQFRGMGFGYNRNKDTFSGFLGFSESDFQD